MNREGTPFKCRSRQRSREGVLFARRTVQLLQSFPDPTTEVHPTNVLAHIPLVPRAVDVQRHIDEYKSVITASAVVHRIEGSKQSVHASNTTCSNQGQSKSELKQKSFDVWPGNVKRTVTPATTVEQEMQLSMLPPRPHLLSKIENFVSNSLSNLIFAFPHLPSHKVPSLREGLSGNDASLFWKDHRGLDEPAWWEEDEANFVPDLTLAAPTSYQDLISTGEDMFAEARMNIFRAAGLMLCKSFRSYHHILSRIFEEFDVFSRHCSTFLTRERAALATERKRLLGESDGLSSQLQDVQYQLKQFHETAEFKHKENQRMSKEYHEMKDDYDNLQRTIRMQETIIECRENDKGALARCIMKLEDDIKLLNEALLAPARKMAVLEAQLASKNDFIKHLSTMNHRILEDNKNMKGQCVALKMTADMAEMNAAGSRQPPLSYRSVSSESHPAGELPIQVLMRRQQGDRDIIANLSQRLEQQRMTNQALATDDGPLTPRPSVHCDDLAEATRTSTKMSLATSLITQLKSQFDDVQKKYEALLELKGADTVSQSSPTLSLSVVDVHMDPSRQWFAGLGDDPKVPLFLRATGQLRNQRFSLMAIKLHIHQFFASVFHQCSSSGRESLSDRFFRFMNVKYHDHATVMTYSLYYALFWFPADVDCKMFQLMLDGKLHENVWGQQQEYVKRMKAEMEKAVIREAQGSMSKLSRVAAREAMVAALPVMDPHLIADLMTAALNFEATVDVRRLFTPQQQNLESTFVELLRTVLLIERCHLLNDVEAAILDDPSSTSGVLTPQQVALAMVNVDPQCTISSVQILLEDLFGREHVVVLPEYELLPIDDRYVNCYVELQLSDGLAKLRTLPLTRHTRRLQRLVVKMKSMRV